MFLETLVAATLAAVLALIGNLILHRGRASVRRYPSMSPFLRYDGNQTGTSIRFPKIH
jgi:hypothetical protein